MKKYILDYIDSVDKNVKDGHKFSEKEKMELKDKIIYFEHERLIHLLVTLFYVIFTLVFFALGMISYIFLVIFAFGIVFLLFYIPYYFWLENHVQYMYKLYDKVVMK